MTNIFIMQVRGPVDMFNSAFGHYADVWAAWAEGIINITVTLATAPFLGICGILLGKITSLVAIVVIWKPIYLYRDGFKLPLWQYWRNIIIYIMIFLGTCMLCIKINLLIPINEFGGFVEWASKAILSVSIFCCLYICLLFFLTKGSRTLINRIKELIIRKWN